MLPSVRLYPLPAFLFVWSAMAAHAQEGVASVSYQANPAIYTVGTAITANLPFATGSAATHYSVDIPLPAGLVLDSGTGAISGTPASLAATGAYVVTAGNPNGSATISLSVTVSNVIAAPGTLRLSQNPVVYASGLVIYP